MENKPSFLSTLSTVWPIAIGVVSAVLYLQSSILSLSFKIDSISFKIDNAKALQTQVDNQQSAEIANVRNDLAELKARYQAKGLK